MLKPLAMWIITNCGALLQRWKYQTILPVFWEAAGRTLCGTTDWFRIEKGVGQGCLLSPCLFNLYTEHIMRNAGLDELQAIIKMGNINNVRYADSALMAESEEELKSLLMRVKKESKKTGLKLSIKKTKIMASGLITSWQIEGEKEEEVTDSSLGLWNHCGWWLQPWNQKTFASWQESSEKLSGLKAETLLCRQRSV